MFNFIKKCSLFHLIVLFFVAVGLFLRIKFYLLNPPLFQDECGTAINVISRNFIGLLKPLEYVQVAPPTYLLLTKAILNFFIQFNNIYLCDLTIKIIPFFSGIAVIPLFAYFCHKVYKNKLYTLACLLMLSLNIRAIDYSQEFKPYSTEMLWTVILAYCFYSFDLNKCSYKKLTLYLLIFCLSLWSSVFAVFILAAGILMVLYNLLKSKNYDKKKIVYFFSVITVNFLVYLSLFVIPSIAYSYDRAQIEWEWVDNAFLTSNNFIYAFCSKISSVLYRGKENIYLFYLFAAVNTLILLYKRNIKMIILMFTPIFLCIIASFMTIYPFECRVLLFLFPLMIMFCCQPLLLLKDNAPKILVMVLIGLGLSYWRISDNDLQYNFKNMLDISYKDFHITEARNLRENLSKAPETVLKYYGCTYSNQDWFFIHWKYYGMMNNNFIDFNITDNTDNLKKDTLYYGYINSDKNGEYKEIKNITVLEEYERKLNDENDKMYIFSEQVSFDFDKAKLFSFKIN